MRMKTMVVRVAHAACLLGVLAACSSPRQPTELPAGKAGTRTPTAEPATSPRFGLHLLDSTWDSMQLGYEPGPAQAKLAAAVAGHTRLRLGEADVASYDWAAQRLRLTAAATKRVRDAFEAPGAAAQVLGLDHRAFVVTVDGRIQFGGVALAVGSPMAIQYPVLHYDLTDAGLTIDLLPSQSFGVTPAELAAWSASFVPVREVFAAAGKLVGP